MAENRMQLIVSGVLLFSAVRVERCKLGERATPSV